MSSQLLTNQEPGPIVQSHPLQQPLLPPPTTTTTEDPIKEGTNLYLLPGVRSNLSFSGVRGCQEKRIERNNVNMVNLVNFVKGNII